MRMAVFGYLLRCLQGVAQRAVIVGPQEVIVVLCPEIPLGIEEGGMGEVEAAVEHASGHASAREGLGQVGAGIDLRGVDLAGRHVHCWTRHALGLDALHTAVHRQRGHLREGDADDVDATDAVDHLAAVVGRERGGRQSVCGGHERENGVGERATGSGCAGLLANEL